MHKFTNAGIDERNNLWAVPIYKLTELEDMFVVRKVFAQASFCLCCPTSGDERSWYIVKELAIPPQWINEME